MSAPPNDPSAEAAVLGALLYAQTGVSLDEIPDLAADAFYSGRNRRIFAAIRELHGEGEPVDVVTVAGRLQLRNESHEIVGYMTELVNGVPAVSAKRLREYARTVRNRATQRALIDLCRKTIATVETEPTDPGDLLADTEQAIHALASGTRANEIVLMKDATRAAFAEIQTHAARTNGQGGATGTSTGFRAMDAHLGGLHGGDLVVLAARPGMGKSALAFQLAMNVAQGVTPEGGPRTEGAGVIAFSLEMRAEQLALRALCADARVDLSDARYAKLDQSQWGRLTGSAVSISKAAPFWIDDNSGTSLAQVRSRARRAQRECERGGRKLGLVILDYLQLVNNKAESREQAIAEVSRNMKGLAKELNVPVLALSQLNRGVESRSDKRPMLGDLRESGAIEQDADTVLMMYRDDYYNKQSDQPSRCEVGIVKQRSGNTGTMVLGFQANTTSFYDVAPEDERG